MSGQVRSQWATNGHHKLDMNSSAKVANYCPRQHRHCMIACCPLGLPLLQTLHQQLYMQEILVVSTLHQNSDIRSLIIISFVSMQAHSLKSACMIVYRKMQPRKKKKKKIEAWDTTKRMSAKLMQSDVIMHQHGRVVIITTSCHQQYKLCTELLQ